MIESVIFDFDGVIADSTNIKTEAFVALYSQYSEETQSQVKSYHIRHSGVSRYKKIYYFQKEIVNEDYSEKKINQLALQFSEIVLENVINSKFIPGAREFIEKNYAHLDLHIATGTPQSEIEIIAQEKKLSHLFKSIYGTPLTKTEIVEKILKKFTYNNKNVVLIGDALADFEGAVNNNIQFLGRVPRGEESIFPENVTVINDLIRLDNLLSIF